MRDFAWGIRGLSGRVKGEGEIISLSGYSDRRGITHEKLSRENAR